jgi:hypothetical protein
MAGCNPCHVPMEARLKLSKQPLVDATAYQSIVESLPYLMNTRPDLVFDVGYVSCFLEESWEGHLATMKWILCYVAGGYQQLGLWFGQNKGNQVLLLGFGDANFAGDIDTRKSNPRVIFFLANNPITWQSTKQRVLT